MDASHHRFSELFAQLGLPDDDASIGAFIRRHRPLPPDVLLAQAPFWTPAQAALLGDEVRRDADWAEVIDQLNLALR
ncbi:DUF2789 domain-containing protein [Paucibacter sp. R3-3]|uniref:DUF2789 domain-containing protein n=1 Tax=Roseateles agri TaxID=3098619 RepID=A0ABU5DIG1_9BURK|nr:DUF2789 domain-containing protein [Paucibacter sp. R3-3]MDY0746089.1 DUF2789 domain-containing protein [Paucibacter sp. R3-3]